MESVWSDWMCDCPLGVATSGNQGGGVFSQCHLGMRREEGGRGCCDIHTMHMVAGKHTSQHKPCCPKYPSLRVFKHMCSSITHIITNTHAGHAHVHTTQQLGAYNAYNRCSMFQSGLWGSSCVWTCSTESDCLLFDTQRRVNRLTQTIVSPAWSERICVSVATLPWRKKEERFIATWITCDCSQAFFWGHYVSLEDSWYA